MTLVETMVSVFILMIMSLIVFETMRGTIEYNRILEGRDETARAARVALSKMKREIGLAYLTPHRQAINNYQTVFVGLDEDPDRLFMASLGHERIYMNTRECDQTEITLFTESSPDERGRGYVLYHREATRIDHEPDEGGAVYPLAYNVRSFNLRYLDSQSNEWKDEWDTRQSETPYRLPRAVEIALVLIGEDPSDEDRTIDVPFLTTVLLEYGDRVVNPSDPLYAQLMSPSVFKDPGAGGFGAQQTGKGSSRSRNNRTRSSPRSSPMARPPTPGGRR